MNKRDIARLWARVDRNGPLVAHVAGMSNCWVWTGKLTAKGRGLIRFGGKQVLSHRASWEAENGPVPNRMCVLHKCDRPSCVRPSHLFLGTQLDNIRDRDAKGRQGTARGETSGTAKLTEADVLSIRAQWADGAKGIALASRFMVGPAQISKIVLRKSWNHLPGSML